MAFGDDFLNRFGPYRLGDYAVPMYSGGAVGGIPVLGQMGGPPVTPPPAPGTGGTGTGTGGIGNPPPPGQSPGAGSGSGQGGNVGGASHGVGGGGAGDNAGHPGAGNATSAAGFNGGLFGNSPGFIDLGGVGSGLLSAAAAGVPGWGGLGLSAIQAALRGWNTGQASGLNSTLGGPGLDLGQWLGGILGLNDYGSLGGNNTIFAGGNGVANPFGGPGAPGGTPVTTGGMYYDGPSILGWHPFDSQGKLAYTPDELSARRASVGIGAPIAGGTIPPARSTAPINRYGAMTAPQYSAADQAALKTLQAMPHVGVGKLLESGLTPMQALARAQAAAGNGTGSFSGTAPTGMGGNGFSGNLSAGAGNAVSAGGTGGLQNGFGGGGYSSGGFVPGRPDNVVDNRPIAADEGEFVLRRDAARILGPGLLNMLNDPGRAGMLRDALGWAEPMAHARTASSPRAAAELTAAIAQEDAGGGVLGLGMPMPMRKPPQLATMGVEGGWPDRAPVVNISGSGHGKPRGKAAARESEADRLNRLELARSQTRRAMQQLMAAG